MNVLALHSSDDRCSIIQKMLADFLPLAGAEPTMPWQDRVAEVETVLLGFYHVM